MRAAQSLGPPSLAEVSGHVWCLGFQGLGFIDFRVWLYIQLMGST